MLRDPAELVFVQGAGCDTAMEKIAAASPKQREQYFNQILKLLEWPDQEFIRRARQPSSSIEEFFTGFSDPDGAALPKEIQSYRCVERLISVYKERAPEVIKAVLKKYGSLKEAVYEGRWRWGNVLRDLCEKNDTCADAFPELIGLLKTADEQIALIDLMIGGGAKSIDAILTYLKMLPDLGFDQGDTAPTTHRLVDHAVGRLAGWFASKEAPAGDKAKQFVLDNSNPTPLRWRLANRLSYQQDPEVSAAMVAMQKAPNFPSAIRTAGFHSNPYIHWRSSPQILLNFVQEGESLLAKAPKLDTTNLNLFEAYVGKLNQFQRLHSPAPLPPNFNESKKRLKLVLNNIAKRAIADIGPNSTLLTSLIHYLRRLDPFDPPLPIALEWLESPENVSRGLELSLLEVPLAKTTQNKILEILRKTAPERRGAFFQYFRSYDNRTSENSKPIIDGIIVPFIPFMTKNERQIVVSALQSERDHAVLSILNYMQREDMEPAERANFLGVLSSLDPTTKTKTDFAEAILKHIKCEANDFDFNEVHSLISLPRIALNTQIKLFNFFAGCPETSVAVENLTLFLHDPKFVKHLQSRESERTAHQNRRLSAALELVKKNSANPRDFDGHDD